MPRNSASPMIPHIKDNRLAAVRARDASADGQFVYSVSTTGIYCRPSCASRPARSEHIVFHRSAADAERAGFRACKRCRPEHIGKPQDANTTLIEGICRLIEESESAPSLAELAAHSGLSSSYLHRLFKATLGVTPKRYIDAERKKRLVAQLRDDVSVTRAIYGSGFNSSSRFYEQAEHMLGMTPTKFKRGAAGEAIHFAVRECSLGQVLVAASTRGVCTITLGDDPNELTQDLKRNFSSAELISADSAFEQVVARVVSAVEHPAMPVEIPLDIRGSAFQCRVWDALRTIRPGCKRTYAQVASEIGDPKAVRAVARACASNRLAVVIPCHRVVRSDGGLAGYRWGVERKQALLEAEAPFHATS
jgi:AraC family transcriptional regulator, regulatory protein of adaptative response / methylated-DNA-[protein]-cysteine methyltransferase